MFLGAVFLLIVYALPHGFVGRLDFYSKDEMDEHGNPPLFNNLLSDPDYARLAAVFRAAYDTTYRTVYHKYCNSIDRQYSKEEASGLTAQTGPLARKAKTKMPMNGLSILIRPAPWQLMVPYVVWLA